MNQMYEMILGYSIVRLLPQQCLDAIEQHLIEAKRSLPSQHTCLWLACFNPHSYVMACNDKVFSNALHAADWLVPDGVGIVIASRIFKDRRISGKRYSGEDRRARSEDRRTLKGQIRARITGSDIFWGLQDRLNMIGGFSVFFLGGTPETLEKIQQKIAVDFPGIHVAGTYSPPFKPEYSSVEMDEMIDKINASGAHILWVGMTAPKQEKWINQNKAKLNVHFAAAVGAVFDFYTGNIERSSPIFQKLGLEWLPRLIKEPRRLWRRMGVSAPIFLYHTLLHKIKDR